MLGSLAVALVVASAAAATSGNMNEGPGYLVSKSTNADPAAKQVFNTDYASKGHEYFDVWAPEIATHYGEVFWTDQGNQPLPDALIQRFKGKTMAITGYEQDQVMVQPVGKPGVDPSMDVSVPINWAYNHHYMAWMTGSCSEMQYIENADPDDTSAHGSPTRWVAVEKPCGAEYRSNENGPRGTPVPTSQMFSEGNGGESRMSFHGYPDGYAQLIESPTSWHITPMQIDTRNRDCGVEPADVTNCTQFVPGPEPKQARYGLGIPAGTNYSGVLECPCNERFGGDPIFYPDARTKIQEHEYQTMASGVCGTNNVADNASCFAAVASLGVFSSTGALVNSTVNDAKLPAGCSIVTAADGAASAVFNDDAASTAQCVAGRVRAGEDTTAVGVRMHVELDHGATGSSAVFARSNKVRRRKEDEGGRKKEEMELCVYQVQVRAVYL